MRNIRMYAFLLSVLIAASCKKDNMFLNKSGTSMESTGINVAAALTSSKIYYVSPSGNDSSNGLSSASAWKTIAKVNATELSPGDLVLFQGGQTFNGRLYIRNSGIAGFNIKFSSYGTGRATINGGSGTAVYAYNCSYISIDSLIVAGSWNATTQLGNDAYGILFYNDLAGNVKLGEVAVNRCEVKGFAKSGIGILSWPADGSQSGYTKISVVGNTVHDNGACGITTLGPSPTAGSTAYAFTSVYVGYNRVYNNLGVKASTGKHSGNGILIGDAAAGTIEYNVAYNNGWYNTSTAGGPAAIWCYDSKNLIFQYNEAHHNGTGPGTPDGDGFDLDGGAVNCIMQYNYSHDNYGAGFLVWEYGNARIKNSGNIIRYNISQNDNTNNNNTVYGGISMGPNCNNNLVYNNTFWSVKGSSVFVTGGTGNKFYNNIFATQGTAPCIVSTSGSFFMNNNYYNPSGFRVRFAGSTYTTLASFRNTANEKYNGVAKGYNVNPQLTSPGTAGNVNTGNPNVITHYIPLSGSAMINTGFNLTTLGLNVGTRDFRKGSIPFGGGYDIGACEGR
ncbi:MAG TPA: right-handed parallel beta-helix repeat-containing protein [Ferruginibacter sp.]|nr:right-handed parallel beta-helix repeat-containing protein [Ferruginibacter sp.]